MAPGDLQLHLESSTRNGTPSPFPPDRDLALPLTCASPIPERKQSYTNPRAVGCAHTRVFTPAHTPTHLGSLSGVLHAHAPREGLSQAPFSFMLPHSSQVHTSSTEPHSGLTITHSLLHAPPAPREQAQTLVETRSDLSHLTHCPLRSRQAHSTAHQPARLQLLAHPPPPHPPARSLGCLPQSPPPPGRPAPQPVHTYGKLPEVAAFSSPSARGGPLSGYQEVNGECQGGGSSTLPVR